MSTLKWYKYHKNKLYATGKLTGIKSLQVLGTVDSHQLQSTVTGELSEHATIAEGKGTHTSMGRACHLDMERLQFVIVNTPVRLPPQLWGWDESLPSEHTHYDRGSLMLLYKPGQGRRKWSVTLICYSFYFSSLRFFLSNYIIVL